MRSQCQSFPTTSYSFSPEEHYAGRASVGQRASLEGPRGQALTTSGLGPLRVLSESPQDEEWQQGEKKGQRG